MKPLSIVVLSGILALAALAQTTKPKTAAAKPKPARTTKSTSTTAKKTAAKPKTATAKPKSQAAKPKAGPAAKPKEAASRDKADDEKAAWEKLAAIFEHIERAEAIRKFLKQFPKTERRAEAIELIVMSEAEAGNLSMQAGDISAASARFLVAAKETPKPVSEKLFNEVLSKFPANLYFRGAREPAFEIAKILEEKSGADVDQLLSIANFYLSVENGSEARRVADAALKASPSSASAYMTLGLANRMDFQLEDSAAAYARALELEPGSIAARRGLAEMKRSLGKPEESIELYREIIAADENNLPARSGLVLALFDAGRRTEAESELERSESANPGNVILLSGAAYWYAVQGEGQKAIELAQKAIAADPRFIWSHIALARGLILEQRPIEAERTLLAARRYGNFPTLEYELASARVAAGFYRDAAEELAKSFTVSDGVVRTKLGGRIPRDSKHFTELIGYERRASIFAPTAADSPENAARLAALLELKQALGSTGPVSNEAVNVATEKFIQGDDALKLFRQIYAADLMLEKKVALPKVVELANSASAFLDRGLASPSSTSATLANELYESRTIAAVRGEYINVPDVPRQTLSGILRGRIEELAGWAKFQMDEPDEAVIRLRRAISVLPQNSAWWRSTTWRLGTSLAAIGKNAEALDAYTRVYRSAAPDQFRYAAIAALYRQIYGNTDKLEDLIGRDPAAPVEAGVSTLAAAPTPAPETVAQRRTPAFTPAVVPIAAPSPEPVASTTPTPEAEPLPTPTPEPEPSPTATPEPEPSPTPVPEPEPSPTATPEPEASPTPTPEPEPSPTPTPEPEPSPTPSPEPEPSPTPTPEPEASPTPTPEPEVIPEPSPTPVPEPTATPERQISTEPAPLRTPSSTTSERRMTPSPPVRRGELFPPVVITIPPPTKPASRSVRSADDTVTPLESTPNLRENDGVPPENAVARREGRQRVVRDSNIIPCTLTVSEDDITLSSKGFDHAVIVGITDEDRDLDDLVGTSSSPTDVSIRREPIAGVKARALFVIKAASSRIGVYQATFELPCGKKDIVIKVR